MIQVKQWRQEPSLLRRLSLSLLVRGVGREFCRIVMLKTAWACIKP